MSSEQAPHRATQKSWLYQSRSSLPDSPATPRYLYKVRSAEVGATKSDSKSVAYENRTESAKCGALETNGSRERISGFRRCVAVRRFAREARGYWASMRARSWQRILVAEGLADRVGFEPTIRFPVYTLSKRAPSATRPPLLTSSR